MDHSKYLSGSSKMHYITPIVYFCAANLKETCMNEMISKI